MKLKKKNWEGSDTFDKVSITKAIPSNAKDGLVGIKWSENDKGYLVVFAPGSKQDVDSALKAFKKYGWHTEYDTYKGHHIICVRDKSKEVNEMKFKKIKNESKIGSIKKLANGCKMRDMGDCFVVTDHHGKNIGQCRTEIEAETIAEEYGSKVNESKSKPSPISIEERERQKEARKLMEHLMKAEDELYVTMNSATRMARYADNQVEREAFDNCASYSETAMKDVSNAKMSIRELKMNESTKKLVKEGPGAGYDIEIKDVKIDKVIKFEESDYRSEYSDEKWYKFEATIKPGIHEIDANTYYDRLVTEDDNEIIIDSGTIYGEIGLWADDGDDRPLDEKIRYEIEGSEITISTMYGGGWIHAYLPEDGNIEFNGVDYKPDSYSFTIDKFAFKSPEMSEVINWNYDHIGEDEEDVDPEEVDESLQDGFTTNKEVTKKVDELVQAVWEDAKKEQKLEAFHMFEKNLSKVMEDYWDRIA